MLTLYQAFTKKTSIHLFLRIKQSNCYSNLEIINFFENEHYLQEIAYINKVANNLASSDYLIFKTDQDNQITAYPEEQEFFNKIHNLNKINQQKLLTQNVIVLIDKKEWKERINEILQTNLVTNLYLIRHEGDFKLSESLTINCDCNICLFDSINTDNPVPFKFEQITMPNYRSGYQYSMLAYIKPKKPRIHYLPAINNNNKYCKKQIINNKLTVYPTISKVGSLSKDPYEIYYKLGSPKYIAAPMIGQTELAFRIMLRKLGVQLCYTPMINAKLFVISQEYRQEMFNTNYLDRPLAVQFAARDPKELLAAAEYVVDQCDLIDINLGCPQPIARRHGYGAWLMEYPNRIYALIQKLKSLGTPISCKIRIFEKIEDTIEYAKMLENAGCSLLTIHGRQRKSNMNTEPADWEHISQVKKHLKIPVIANGSISSLEAAKECLSQTGCAGVMAASHLLENPYLFTGKICHPQEMALEYLAYAKQYNAPLNYAIAHILQITQKYLAEQFLMNIKQAVSIEQTINYLKNLNQGDFILKATKESNAIDLIATANSNKKQLTSNLNLTIA